MYFIQIGFGKKWCNGIITYPTLEAAERRLKELEKVGITGRICPVAEEERQ